MLSRLAYNAKSCIVRETAMISLSYGEHKVRGCRSQLPLRKAIGGLMHSATLWRTHLGIWSQSATYMIPPVVLIWHLLFSGVTVDSLVCSSPS